MKEKTQKYTVNDQGLSYIGKLEAANILRIKKRTLECWMKKKIIPHYRIGGSIRFLESELREHLKLKCHIDAI